MAREIKSRNLYGVPKIYLLFLLLGSGSHPSASIIHKADSANWAGQACVRQPPRKTGAF
jgi:hypothetical protein